MRRPVFACPPISELTDAQNHHRLGMSGWAGSSGSEDYGPNSGPAVFGAANDQYRHPFQHFQQDI